jgi:hypothetical protein
MKNLNFCLGLPRSGSTLLVSILNENPNIYGTGTCPVPYLFASTRQQCVGVSEFISMDMDVLNKSVMSFLRSGTKAWYESQTSKPVVFSKSRVWDNHLDLIFALFENPKIIVTIRDLRGIVCSFEKLYNKYNYLQPLADQNGPMCLDQRIDSYISLENPSNLGRPLSMLPNIMDYANKYPKNFFILRNEDFLEKPVESLGQIYQWLEMPVYNHDLNNIPNLEYVEHDTVYRSAVSHKIKNKFDPKSYHWSEVLSDAQSKRIINSNKWYYDYFYPDAII